MEEFSTDAEIVRPMESGERLYLRAIREKALRRRKLAKLPILVKINIIVEMQRAVNALCRATGRPVHPVWPVKKASPGKHRTAGPRSVLDLSC